MMGDLLVINTSDAAAKLRNLRAHLPGTDDLLERYGRRLADRMNPELNQFGFAIAATSTLDELRRDDRAGYPDIIFTILFNRIPEIADAVCPAEFGAAVREVFNAARADAQAAR
jgi:hypothetical protein